jgi:peptide/nickel transport system permease protein
VADNLTADVVTRPAVPVPARELLPAAPARLSFRRQHQALWRFQRHRVGVFGGGIVLAVTLAAVFAPVIAPHDPLAQNLLDRFAGIGEQGYVLGADAFGRDMLSRLIWGGRISLLIGIVASVVALGIGVPLGMLAGYRGGVLDGVAMRVMEMLLAFPYILLAIVIVGALGPGLTNTIIAVAVTSIPFYARLMRGIVLSVKNQPFIDAAVAMGATETRILRTAVFPAILSYVIVAFTISVAWLILEGASLSFLGLGAQPPSPEWGAMLAESRQYISIAPHTVLLPGLMLLLVAAGLNLFGDALRDALDVTLKD